MNGSPAGDGEERGDVYSSADMARELSVLVRSALFAVKPHRLRLNKMECSQGGCVAAMAPSMQAGVANGVPCSLRSNKSRTD